MLRYKVLSGSCVSFVLAILVVAIVPFRAKDLFAGNRPWTNSGSFQKGGAWPFTTFDPQMSPRDRTRSDFWGSWSGSNAYVGELRSPVFKAPRILQCYLSGYPGKPGLDLFLERQSDHLRIPLPIPGNSFPGEVWRRFYWWLPDTARGQQVTLVALDHSSDAIGWFGVSTPRRFSYLALLHQELPSNLFVMAHFLVNFALFLLPGFGVACLLLVKWPTALRYPVITLVVTGAVLGYLCFYAFLFAKPAGTVLSIVIYLASLIFIGYALRSNVSVAGLLKTVAEPFVITALTGLCYLCFTFVFINPMTTGASYLDGRFFTNQIPGDNLIPVFFAERIYDRTPLRPFCCGGWLSSDRPPLQTGIFLMQRPLPLPANVELNYQLLATGLQCLWICGVWCLLESLGAAVIQRRRALALLIFCGFIFYNSVYTWPKFLTATLVLFAISILIEHIRNRRVATYADTVLASLCVGLALVSHPGSLFSLITLPLFLFYFRSLFPIRKLAWVLPILMAFVLPWSAYQKVVDPPGNRLIKWHLAGDQEIDPATPSEAIRNAYAAHSFKEIAALKWSNIRILASEHPLRPFDLRSNEASRILQREFLWNAVGLLNLGWLAAIYVFFRRPSIRKIPYSSWLIPPVALNMLFWCLIEFGPQYTIMATGSYADYLMLCVALLGFVLEFPKLVISAILALQLMNFMAVWVWSPPYAFNSWAGTLYSVSLQLPLLIFGVVFTALLLTHLCRSLAPSSRSAAQAVACAELNARI
jgi:hypothetical protein